MTPQIPQENLDPQSLERSPRLAWCLQEDCGLCLDTEQIGKSWYLCSHPATNETQTTEWLTKLEAVCGKL